MLLSEIFAVLDLSPLKRTGSEDEQKAAQCCYNLLQRLANCCARDSVAVVCVCLHKWLMKEIRSGQNIM